MSIELPIYRQETPRTCALACLRMALAAHGTSVEEYLNRTVFELPSLRRLRSAFADPKQHAVIPTRIF